MVPRTSNTLTVWSAPQEASSSADSSSVELGFRHRKRWTVDTWHKTGSNRSTHATLNGESGVLPAEALPPETLQSSINPLSMPTARTPALEARSWPIHANAVTLSRNWGNVASSLTEDASSTHHILTLLSLDPVANS